MPQNDLQGRNAPNKMNGGEKHWYGLRVTYARELKAKAWFEAAGIECFLPMRFEERCFMGKTNRLSGPAFHNLIFIRTDEKTQRETKVLPGLPIRYIMDRETRRPLTVPEKEMADFMSIAGSEAPGTEYGPVDAAEFSIGNRVRITQGPLNGIEGTFLRTGNEGRIAVQAAGMVVLTAPVPVHFVKQIDKNQPLPTKS